MDVLNIVDQFVHANILCAMIIVVVLKLGGVTFHVITGHIAAIK